MDQENITFSKNRRKAYTMTNLHILVYNTSFGCDGSYNYYDIDVNKILLLKKSDREYFVRYNDVNEIVPLQLKIENYYFDELNFSNYTSDVTVEGNDKEFFIKCRETENKISELMNTDNLDDFVVVDDYGESIILDIEKNISAIGNNYRNDLVFVFTSVINNSLVQYCKQKILHH